MLRRKKVLWLFLRVKYKFRRLSKYFSVCAVAQQFDNWDSVQNRMNAFACFHIMRNDTIRYLNEIQ